MASAPAWSRHLLLSIFRTWGASPTQLLGEPVLAPCRTQTSPAAQEANSSTSASGGGGGGGRDFLANPSPQRDLLSWLVFCSS